LAKNNNSITINKPGNYTYTLDQSGQEIEIIGRFKADKKQQKNIVVTVIHQATNTKATVSLKATAKDNARIHISGNIIVEKTATNTESFLEERVLLLSPTASAEAIPNLEIKTNEVKCSHAATVGTIDDEQIFYLNSRGIPSAQAEEIIVAGFLE